MKTFKLTLRESMGERFWCTDQPNQSSVWLGFPLVCAELGHLGGFPKLPIAKGTEVTVDVSTRKLLKGRQVELLDSGDWKLGRITEAAANRVSAFLHGQGLPRKFWIRVRK